MNMKHMMFKHLYLHKVHDLTRIAYVCRGAGGEGIRAMVHPSSVCD